ncbi:MULTISPECIES: hypothetical protein [Microcystis]|nr:MULTISPECIES: hypothetical protein [Microcystis]
MSASLALLSIYYALSFPRLAGISYQLSVISYQLSVISYQF